MLKKISLKLPFSIFEELRKEAERKYLSVSDVVREKIISQTTFRFREPEEPNFKKSEEKIEALAPYPSTESDFALLEILLLLREFLFERNGQILKKVDEKLERRFGKDRKRV